MIATETPLPAADDIRSCLDSLLGKAVQVEQVTAPSVTLRRNGRDGLVVGELLAGEKGTLDGYFSFTATMARQAAASLLMTEFTAGAIPDAAIEACQEVLNVLTSTMNTAAPDQHWVLGRTRTEAGAQALDPLLATARSQALYEIQAEDWQPGWLGICLGAEAVAAP